MSSKRSGINIPGVILDELKERDYSNDERFKLGKRKPKGQLNRKDRRKLQRAQKKQKGKKEVDLDKVLKKKPQQQNSATRASANKKDNRKSKEDALPFSSDDELSSGDFDEFEEGDLNEEEWEQLRELEGSEQEEDSGFEESSSDASENHFEDPDEDEIISEVSDESEESELTVDETYAQLKALKDKKSGNVKHNKRASIKQEPSSESESDDSVSKLEEEETFSGSDLSGEEVDSGMSVEETYAKLKALKEAKKWNNHKLETVVGIEGDEDENFEEEYSDLPDSEFDDEEEQEDDQEMTVEETMNKLKELKKMKDQSKRTENQSKKSVRFSSENQVKVFESYRSDDSISDEIISESDDFMSDELISDSDEVISNDDDDDDEEEEEEEEEEAEMTPEETWAALRKLKESKNSTNHKDKADTTSKKLKTKSKSKSDEVVEFPLSPMDRAAIQRDEWDMEHYAKKLGLKGKGKKLKARDEYDAIGGLLEGLDYFENYGEDEETDSSESVSSVEDSSEYDEEDKREDVKRMAGNSKGELPFPSDDELSSGDFDEFDENDLNEEEWAQLRELEESDEEESDGEDTKSSKKKKNKRENPYVAPAAADTEAYVPPSLRKNKLNEDSDNSMIIEIRKKVKSSLNKLSDSNLVIMVSTLNELYDTYPRQYVSDSVTKEMMQIIAQNNKLLDSFIMNYAAIVYSLWRLRGIEVGASFLQQIVEHFLKHLEKQLDENESMTEISEDSPQIIGKQSSNIISLISYCYNFGLMSSSLVFDMIKQLITKPNEFTIELLLRIVSISGPLIRSDDPSALKDIIADLLSNVKVLKTVSPRMQFLLDTMADLKNNRLKPSIMAADFHPTKKNVLSAIRGSNTEEPLQVSLDDIKNIETKGKWWLIGASWKGNMNSAFEEGISSGAAKNIVSEMDIKDDFLDDIPDWAEIARSQRMNTELRRAIFVSIMSAQDYVDASSKIEKLNLKNKQLVEVPKVIMHCLLSESGKSGYNPYYYLVANKLCELNGHLQKPFQFLFWDILKRFEDNSSYDSDEDDLIDDSEDVDENTALKRTISQGKFFGSMIAEQILKLDVLKHAPIIGGLKPNGYIFMEVMIYQLLILVAKKSEKKSKSKTEEGVAYTTSLLKDIIVRGIKDDNKSFILKGLNWFLGKKRKFHNYISGRKGDKKYEKDSRRLDWGLSATKHIINEELSINAF
ncbi:MIF4G domain [Nakaseomyces glabratus]